MNDKLIIRKPNTPEFARGEAEALIAQAIDKNVPVETMEKLLAMRRELKKEHAKEEYDKAMAKFQSQCPTIEKTKAVKTNSGATAYKYAPIESIVEQVKEYLKRNGFSYSTNMKMKENSVIVTVKVTHSAGHSEETEMEVPFGNMTAMMSKTQQTAAASTFAKRYAFCNAFGILTGDEDTDARPVDTQTPKLAPKATTQAPIVALMSVKQENYINGLLKQKGKSKVSLEETCKNLFKKPFERLTWDEASNVIDRLNKLPSILAIPERDKESFDPNEPLEVDPDEAEKGIEAMNE